MARLPHRIFTLGLFGRIVCKPSHYYSLRGVARWIPRHERRWCAISRRSSYHLPFAKIVSERWLVLDDLMVEGGEDKELLDFFTKHSHHQNITVLYLCQDRFPPGKYAKSISRNVHYIVAFKNLRDQLGMWKLPFQAFPACRQDMMDVYKKSDRISPLMTRNACF